MLSDNYFIFRFRQPHLEIKSRTRIEDKYIPLTITASSTTPDSSMEIFLLVCNDNAKLRLINADTKLCRKVLSLPQIMQAFKVIII